jgi:non-ribosomal peptide synthetase component E (peptide arylation enzyme)
MESNNPSFNYRMIDEVISKYESKGFWQGRVFPDYLEDNFKRVPEREALVDSRHRITFSDLNRIVNNLASNLLEMGIRKNDVIGVQTPNRVEYFFMRYALAKIGAVILGIGIGMRDLEIRHLLRITSAKGMIVPATFHGFNYADMMKDLRQDLPALKYILLIDSQEKGRCSGIYPFEALLKDRPVNDQIKGGNYRRLLKGSKEIDMLNLTSGTTGMPKICQCIPDARMCFGRFIAERCEITSEDTMLVVCPITGGLGNSCSSLAAGHAGCKVVLLERFIAEEALQMIGKEKVTVLVGVPTQYIKMLSIVDFDHYSLDSLRTVISAGSYLPYEIGKEIIKRMKAKLIPIFGSHDGGTLTIGTPDLDEETVCRTVCRPLPDAELRLLDRNGRQVSQGEVGEIVYRSANACAGYFEDFEGTKAVFDPDGFFYSGDLGRLTKEGFLEVKGRSKDIIIRGGQNINPSEIEDILIKHPDIENVAIVGMPDPVLGERSCAYVVPKEGKRITLQSLISFLKEKKLATFKHPERLEIIDEIPVSEGRKPAKNLLKRDIQNKLIEEGVLSPSSGVAGGK